MGLALVSLAVSYVRGRMMKTAPHAIHFTHEASEKQGDRFDAMYPETKQNVYAPVLA
jgi:hypothetical protein